MNFYTITDWNSINFGISIIYKRPYANYHYVIGIDVLFFGFYLEFNKKRK